MKLNILKFITETVLTVIFFLLLLFSLKYVDFEYLMILAVSILFAKITVMKTDVFKD